MNNNSNILVGLTGRAGVGKTTAAKCMANHGFNVFSFASPIRQMLATISEEFYNADKLAPLDDFKGVTKRSLMQTLGTEWGRNMVHPDLWVHMAEQRIKRLISKYGSLYNKIVFDDVRFENEALWIRANGGIIVHIERMEREAQSDGHASEKGVKFHPADIEVFNRGNLITYHEQIESLIFAKKWERE